jgi:hypothetical protein
MTITRIRSQVYDRHAIGDPIQKIGINGEDRFDLTAAEKSANTLMKTRIPQLFLTLPRLEGHVEQLQNELNRFKVSNFEGKRIKMLEGCSTKDIPSLIIIMKRLRNAVIKAKNASTIPLPNNLFLNFPLISDKVRI